MVKLKDELIKAKEEKKELTCFIIMPISDQDGYLKEHFSRVYNHIIKPACVKAGFRPIRADENTKTDFIVIDIITKILDSDMVICDLSAKNPNVLYELGLRQAFNKKTLLIKDIKTERIFDIQGLRSIDYNESLRIDSVIDNVSLISNALQETYNANSSDTNSLISLLAIKPATLNDRVELSNDSSVLLKAIKDVQSRLNSIEKTSNLLDNIELCDINDTPFNVGYTIYSLASPGFEGKLKRISGNKLFIEIKGITKSFSEEDIFNLKISNVPF